MKKGKTDWKILKRLAELSPKSYAVKIRKRNKWAMKQLALPSVQWNGNDHVWGQYECPHCNSGANGKCSLCLWAKAGAAPSLYIGTPAVHCGSVMFGGSTLAKVPLVCYCSDSIEVYNPHLYSPEALEITLHYIRATLRFLQAHIDWTNKYEWGKDYKRYKK